MIELDHQAFMSATHYVADQSVYTPVCAPERRFEVISCASNLAMITCPNCLEVARPNIVRAKVTITREYYTIVTRETLDTMENSHWQAQKMIENWDDYADSLHVVPGKTTIDFEESPI